MSVTNTLAFPNTLAYYEIPTLQFRNVFYSTGPWLDSQMSSFKNFFATNFKRTNYLRDIKIFFLRYKAPHLILPVKFPRNDYANKIGPYCSDNVRSRSECWSWSLDGRWWNYFADCWQSTRDFRPAVQASPNPLIKY